MEKELKKGFLVGAMLVAILVVGLIFVFSSKNKKQYLYTIIQGTYFNGNLTDLSQYLNIYF
jgi:hypothetical protein